MENGRILRAIARALDCSIKEARESLADEIGDGYIPYLIEMI